MSFSGPSALLVLGAPPDRMLRNSSINGSVSLQHLTTFGNGLGSSAGNSAQDTVSEDWQHFSADSVSLQSMSTLTGVSSAVIGNAALLTSRSSSPDKHGGLEKGERKGTVERGDVGGSGGAASAAAVAAPERRTWQAPQVGSSSTAAAVAQPSAWLKDPGVLTARSHVQHSTLGTVFESDSLSPLRDVDGSGGVGGGASEAITEDELEDAGRTKPLDAIFGAMPIISTSCAAAVPTESHAQSQEQSITASTHLLDSGAQPIIAEAGPTRPPDPSTLSPSGVLEHSGQASSWGGNSNVLTSSPVSGRQHLSPARRSSGTSGVWIQLPGFPSAAPKARPPAEQP